MIIIKECKPAELPESKMFTYAPGVDLWIRPMKNSIMKQFYKQCTKTTMQYNAQARSMDPVEEVDKEKLNDLIADYTLEKWSEGAFGRQENGRIIPYDITLAGKKAILDEPSISDFVLAATKALDTTEAELKNLPTSPASS